MAKYQNFELREFVESDVATARKIDNFPTFAVVQHLDELVGKILQPLRIAWAAADGHGSGLRITSGYRCRELNSAIGGVSNSAHLSGYAADVRPMNGKDEEFIIFAEKWLKRENIAFDQSILEKKGKITWWHISLKGDFNRQRKQFLAIDTMLGKARKLEYTG